jgi:hypothetical protein
MGQQRRPDAIVARPYRLRSQATRKERPGYARKGRDGTGAPVVSIDGLRM